MLARDRMGSIRSYHWQVEIHVSLLNFGEMECRLHLHRVSLQCQTLSDVVTSMTAQKIDLFIPPLSEYAPYAS